MPRPQRCRRICGLPRVGAFGPQEGRAEAPIVLTLDEYEVIRLVDLEEKTQGACAARRWIVPLHRAGDL
ncbi:MAG: DUF134 domain-containing protein [Evtepia sp.]